MQISKLLEIATANYDEFIQIYEAVKEEDVWEKVMLDDPTEKDKIRKAVEIVDEQTYELMVPPLSLLKSKAQRVVLHHENKKTCSFDNNYSSLSTKVSSTKKTSHAWFSLYYEWLTKDGPWGLGMCISITELDKIYTLSPQRRKLEKELQKIIGKDWATTEEWVQYLKQIGISDENINDEIEEGGSIRYKKPVELLAGNEISKIHERIIEVGLSSFIQNIPEFKKFWKDKLRDIEI
jgi:hypothetical protein